jgi:predicted SAM-dependent methyltransferase
MAVKKTNKTVAPKKPVKKTVSAKKQVAELKLDIACGQNKREGFTGVDIAPGEGVDIVHNLDEYPWPFKANSVTEVNISHYVEHVADLISFMNELWRIMKPGAQCSIVAPYYSSMRAWQDPTHVRAISEASFLYFNQDWLTANKLNHYPIKADFDFSYGYSITPEWQNRNEEARNFAIRHYINVVNDIQVVLTKRESS